MLVMIFCHEIASQMGEVVVGGQGSPLVQKNENEKGILSCV